MKILIIEDNEDNRRLAGKRLRASGHVLVEAARGDVALELARAEAPDLVLLDLQLPDTDGLTIARALRAAPDLAHVVIVACTAFAYARDEERALAAGCDAWLSKPVDIRALPSQLEAILEAHRR